MSNANYVYQGTSENFDTLVVSNSNQGPVLVNFYAPDAAPCQIQTQKLAELADELSGQFLLVNINVEQERGLVANAGLRAIPSAQIYADGKMQAQISGATSIADFRAYLKSYIPRPTDKDRVHARYLHETGDHEQAYQVLAEAIIKDPDYEQLPLDLAKLLLLDGKADQARNLLESLPEKIRNHPEVEALAMHAEFISAAAVDVDESVDSAESAESNGAENLFRLAARAVIADDPETALVKLMQLNEREPGFHNGLPMRSLKALFSLLGEDHELVRACRAQMMG